MSEPLVLIPGMMCDARIFSPQITAFSSQRAVHVPCLTNCESIPEMAQKVLQSAPPYFALAGISMGGMVAMEIFHQAPERVSRICLISTNAQSETPAVAASREPQIVKVMGGRLEEVMCDVMRPEYLAEGPQQGRILALMQAMALHLGEGEFVRQSRALQRRPDQQKTLRKIHIPCLILCGAQDRLTLPRRHEFMAQMVPYASLTVIENAGHLPTLETPEQTNQALEGWLQAPLVLR
ncbi:MAG: alpha/beta hydrolase [Rhodobacterales bacterium]|nr:MAG: alpha/beta hydrolase [Rhodobacterales bacterium]